MVQVTKFLENQEEYLGVNSLEVMNSFEIDLVKLMDKMKDTTSTIFSEDRYIEL